MPWLLRTSPCTSPPTDSAHGWDVLSAYVLFTGASDLKRARNVGGCPKLKTNQNFRNWNAPEELLPGPDNKLAPANAAIVCYLSFGPGLLCLSKRTWFASLAVNPETRSSLSKARSTPDKPQVPSI
jgi:hypothetical protein